MLGLFAKRSISATDAYAAQQAGRTVVVDVREDSERATAYVPGSRHMPLGQLGDRLAELPDGQDVAFICQAGRRSAAAVSMARKAGRTSRSVTGGMAAWRHANLPVERTYR